jgi:acetyl esterase/lipase
MNRQVPHLPGALALKLSALLLCASTWAAQSPAPKIPVGDFAREPDITAAKLSPDGKFMGYLFVHDGRQEVSFLDLATERARYYNPGYGQMLGFNWVSDERVVVSMWGGLGAINRNTDGWVGLTGSVRYFSRRGSTDLLYANEAVYLSGRDPRRVLLLDRNTYHGERVLYPDLLTIDTKNGDYHQLIKNPGRVIAWMADWEGTVRYGLTWENKTSQLIYREKAEAPWQTLPGLGEIGQEHSLLGLDRTGRILHVGQAGLKGRWAIFPFDLEKKQMGEPIFDHDEYDIVPPDFNPYYAGVPLAAAVYSPKARVLLGVRYVTEGPRQFWFDPAMENLQKQIDGLHPDLTNRIVSMDYDENRLLVLSWSDREPGFYSLVDLASQKIKPIGRRMPWIKSEQMAEMFPIECRARDGLALRGYLTLPPSGAKKNLPLVMFVHGGPWVRDVWGFDPTVQFLASRGYAVLQINYRGSSGYGLEFSAKGKGAIGGAIQDDITDAVRWVIKQGIADAQRIAIMGASYGGYSTLFALAKDPELYRCGVDIAGVTDWPDLLKERDKPENQISYAYWEKRLGDLQDEKVIRRLAEVSPVNFAGEIKAPLLIVHGKEDRVVPIAQAKKIATLLKKLGRKPETLYFDDLGHAIPDNKQGVEFYTKLEAFLAANLGAK